MEWEEREGREKKYGLPLAAAAAAAASLPFLGSPGKKKVDLLAAELRTGRKKTTTKFKFIRIGKLKKGLFRNQVGFFSLSLQRRLGVTPVS